MTMKTGRSKRWRNDFAGWKVGHRHGTEGAPPPASADATPDRTAERAVGARSGAP